MASININNVVSDDPVAGSKSVSLAPQQRKTSIFILTCSATQPVVEAQHATADLLGGGGRI